MTIQQKFDVSGRVAIVTGGGGLLGAEFCRTLAEAGAAIVVVDLNAPTSRMTADTLTHSGYAAVAMAADITQPHSAKEIVERTLSEFGRLDILVNCAALDPKIERNAENAGVAQGAFEDYPLELWNLALNVNLTGMFLMTQACVQPMLDQGKRGNIINVGSTYGLNGPDQRIYVKDGQRLAFKPVYYTVTKAGVMGFTKYLAAYYAGTSIRVNGLTPGGVFNDHEDYFVKNYSAKTIMGRMAQKDEMNGALLFLASDASAYMTGSNIVVDGGWTAW